MKKCALLVLAAMLLCLILTACVEGETELTEAPSDISDTIADMTDPQETLPVLTAEDPTLDSPDHVYPTLPEFEMPTKPGNVYELPPGEKPEDNLVGK